jgi:cytochrome c peroxidase
MMLSRPVCVVAFVLGFVAMSMIAAWAQQAAQSLPPSILLSETEIAKIERHGPWPPLLKRDLSNKASGDPKAIELGRSLFFDRRLSKNGLISCASCHRPTQGWADGVAISKAPGTAAHRNTQSLLDVRFNRWFGWGGQADNLWAQSIRPIIAPTEMAATPSGAVRVLQRDEVLLKQYRQVFGSEASFDDIEGTLANLGKALAAFQETLVSGRTPFDDFRDALVARDWKAAGTYPSSAQRGAKIFVGRGRCNICHFGARFSTGEFHDAGVPYFITRGKVDPGRFNGVKAVKRNPWNLVSRHNDDPKKTGAWASRQVVRLHRNFGEFRIPTLRNLAKTAPYMHNGSLPTLERVVRHYSEINMERLHSDGEQILKPLKLSDGEMSDLVSFLKTLSAEN